ncbi:MAG TPA: hypothetical protein VFH51_15110, partial [Myxococcota bacterium]|nr:hypothetical protein [Myxococcota bacterium]
AAVRDGDAPHPQLAAWVRQVIGEEREVLAWLSAWAGHAERVWSLPPASIAAAIEETVRAGAGGLGLGAYLQRTWAHLAPRP